MNFLFITRCYKTTNLGAVNKSIRDVFTDTEHTYVHMLIVDLTRGGSRDDFLKFDNDHTELHFVTSKQSNDAWMDIPLDFLLRRRTDDDSFVYMLDDDNLLHKNFLEVAEHCENTDAVVFKTFGYPDRGRPELMTGEVIGKIDWSNFITRLGIMKMLTVYHGGESGVCEDGIFFLKMRAVGCRIKFVDKILAYYNKLPKP